MGRVEVPSFLRNDSDWTVVITMAVMGVMEVTIHEIVHVISVGYRFMTASRAVNMVSVMAIALMIGGAVGRIGFGYFYPVFVDVIAMGVMEMSIVKVIRVIIMLDGCMPAVRAVHVGMVGVGVTICAHFFLIL